MVPRSGRSLVQEIGLSPLFTKKRALSQKTPAAAFPSTDAMMLPDASRRRRTGAADAVPTSPQWDRSSGVLPIPNNFLFRTSSRAERRRMIEEAYRQHEHDLKLWEAQKDAWKTAKETAAPTTAFQPVDHKCPSFSILRQKKSVQGQGGSLRKAVE